MNNFKYPVLLIYSKEDGSWLARVDLLPGCVTDGRTAEEALANAAEAIETWIETCKELGRPIPPPLDAQELEDLNSQATQFQQGQVEQMINQAVNQAVVQVMQNFQKTMSDQEKIGTQIGLIQHDFLRGRTRVLTEV